MTIKNAICNKVDCLIPIVGVLNMFGAKWNDKIKEKPNFWGTCDGTVSDKLNQA